MDNEVIIVDAVKDLTTEDINGVPKESKSTKVPVLTAEIVLQVIADLQNVESNNGLVGIAMKNSVSRSQVRQIKHAANTRLMQIAEEKEGPKEEPEEVVLKSEVVDG